MIKSKNTKTIKLVMTSVVTLKYNPSDISKKDAVRFMKAYLSDNFPVDGGNFDFAYKLFRPSYKETS